MTLALAQAIMIPVNPILLSHGIQDLIRALAKVIMMTRAKSPDKLILPILSLADIKAVLQAPRITTIIAIIEGADFITGAEITQVTVTSQGIIIDLHLPTTLDWDRLLFPPSSNPHIPTTTHHLPSGTVGLEHRKVHLQTKGSHKKNSVLSSSNFF
jgi:hypothetical protein